MKRGGRLQRRTPLRARRVEHRTPPWPPVERPKMDLHAARRALAHQAAAAAVEPAFRPVAPPVVSPPQLTGAFSPRTRVLIIDRDRGRCQRCGRVVSDSWPGYSLQHRDNRGQGGTSDPRRADADNGVLLCGSATTGCHGWAESNPADAERAGFAVASWADPESVPMCTFRGWVHIDRHGNVTPTDPPLGGDAHAVARRKPTVGGRGSYEDRRPRPGAR